MTLPDTERPDDSEHDADALAADEARAELKVAMRGVRLLLTHAIDRRPFMDGLMLTALVIGLRNVADMLEAGVQS